MSITTENMTRTMLSEHVDPTIAPLPQPVNVAEMGFEGRFEDWADHAEYYEYTRAANPLAPGGPTTAIPAAQFGSELHTEGATAVVPLDLAGPLGISEGPATSPALLASFLRIRRGDSLPTAPNATSELYYVLYGRGFSAVNGSLVRWAKGDFLTLPAGSRSTHHADEDTAIYWVTDEPLLRYLGVQATTPRFRPTKFAREHAVAELQRIADAPGANDKNRVSVLLANEAAEQTLTITHVLWAMFGLLPDGQVQRPHRRHQSVALDLILDSQPGCYSLLGDRLDDRGNIVDAIRVDWQPGGAFVTPPGKWHAHYNESGAPAHLIPVQDAGLHTHLRSLDIRFTDRR